jgi:hypothetical protein
MFIKCEASNWRFHSLPNMEVGEDETRWILADILQMFSTMKHLINTV